MPRATLSVLPIELIEIALDFLRGDAKTLAICCRVCRTWSPRARYNLYYQVELILFKIVPFYAAVDRNRDAATAIRELSLQGGWEKPKEPMRHLRTTNLRTLRLHYVDLNNAWLPLITYHARCSLTTLSLKRCSIITPRKFVRFLQRLPHLAHLEGLEISSKKREEDVDPTEALPALQSLCLLGRKDLALSLLQIFTAAPSGLQNLTVLRIALYTRQLAKFDILLASFAENLRELELAVDPDDTPPEQTSLLSLSACRRLSTLTFEARLCHVYSFRFKDHLSWVGHFLETIHAEDLRFFKLVVRATGAMPADFANMGLSAVDCMLCRAPFSSLQRVVVHVKKVSFNMERDVRRQMAMMDLRGILHYVQTAV